MGVFLVSLLSFLPGVLWLLYFYRSDRYDPEPRKLVARTFLVGALVAVAMALAYRGLPFIHDFLIAAIVIAPFVEEIAKFLSVRFSIYEHKEFNEPLDGIIYACSAALGFAAVENVAYVLNTWYQVFPGASLIVLASRSVISVPGHALFSSFWGAALGYAKYRKGIKPVLFVSGGLLISMLLHGGFNYLVFKEPLGGLGLLILVAIMWRVVYKMIVRALSNSPFVPSGEEKAEAEKKPGRRKKKKSDK